MSVIEEAIYTKLTTTAAITALVSTRVYPMKIPQGATLPCITYQRIDTPRVNTHDTSDATGLAYPRFQFDVWSDTYSVSKSIADAIRGVLNGFKGTVSGVVIQGSLIQDERPEFNPEVNLYRNSSDYQIWHSE